MDKTITINPTTYKKLKKAYSKAVAEKKTQFTYEGNELLVAYAKYLLQYMESVLK